MAKLVKGIGGLYIELNHNTSQEKNLQNIESTGTCMHTFKMNSAKKFHKYKKVRAQLFLIFYYGSPSLTTIMLDI